MIEVRFFYSQLSECIENRKSWITLITIENRKSMAVEMGNYENSALNTSVFRNIPFNKFRVKFDLVWGECKIRHLYCFRLHLILLIVIFLYVTAS